MINILVSRAKQILFQIPALPLKYLYVLGYVVTYLLGPIHLTSSCHNLLCANYSAAFWGGNSEQNGHSTFPNQVYRTIGWGGIKYHVTYSITNANTCSKENILDYFLCHVSEIWLHLYVN